MSSLELSPRQIKFRAIAKLKPHPRQHEIFTNVADSEIDALADNIKKNGLNHPVEITRDGTIICGHQRVEAAKRLGWKEIACWIRSDLEEAGDAAVERRLIEDNATRRQLSKTGMARCFIALKQTMARGSGRQNLRDLAKHEIKGELRDFFAGRFGMSGRTLDRYATILTTPLAVQKAFDADKISLDAALAIAKAPRTVQLQIAEALAAGKSLETLLPQVRAATLRKVKPRTVIGRLRKTLETLLDSQSDLIEAAETWSGKSDLTLLSRVVTMCDELSKAVQSGIKLRQQNRNPDVKILSKPD